MRAQSMQEAVDSLAARAGRPAVIEDYEHRVIVYSEHDEPVDDVRRLSILRRHTTAEVVTWLRQQGITRATGPVRVPACPRLGMLARICVPIRHGEQVMGYVWFIEDGLPMSAADLASAAGGAEDLAALLLREIRASEARRRAGDALRDLLSGSAPAREAAIRDIADDGFFTAAASVTALVLLLPEGTHRAEAAIEDVLTAAVRAEEPHSALHLTRRDHGVLLTTAPGGSADRLYAVAHRLLGPVAVGAGTPQDTLDSAAESYHQAQFAARVGMLQCGLGPVVHWAGLGVYRFIGLQQGTPESAHPGLARLLASPAHEPLLHTLETYLDLAGNAGATAERLHMHRTSLYYRLQRIEELAGTNLKDGGERLCLHLALKVARLNRVYGL